MLGAARAGMGLALTVRVALAGAGPSAAHPGDPSGSGLLRNRRALRTHIRRAEG